MYKGTELRKDKLPSVHLVSLQVKDLVTERPTKERKKLVDFDSKEKKEEAVWCAIFVKRRSFQDRLHKVNRGNDLSIVCPETNLIEVPFILGR